MKFAQVRADMDEHATDVQMVGHDGSLASSHNSPWDSTRAACQL